MLIIDCRTEEINEMFPRQKKTEKEKLKINCGVAGEIYAINAIFKNSPFDR